MAEVVDIIEPFIVEIGATPVKIFPAYANIYAHTCFIMVRSMGGASYVALGTSVAQHDRLLGIGDYRGYEVPGMLVNVGKLFAVSDTAGAPAVLEVSGLFSSSGVI